ncbi:MAG TPA: hypothetical protein DCR50_04435, partial [Afipia sp.]|nr:hypothetical protein [Afipia sp.]
MRRRQAGSAKLPLSGLSQTGRGHFLENAHEQAEDDRLRRRRHDLGGGSRGQSQDGGPQWGGPRR